MRYSITGSTKTFTLTIAPLVGAFEFAIALGLHIFFHFRRKGYTIFPEDTNLNIQQHIQ